MTEQQHQELYESVARTINTIINDNNAKARVAQPVGMAHALTPPFYKEATKLIEQTKKRHSISFHQDLDVQQRRLDDAFDRRNA